MRLPNPGSVRIEKQKIVEYLLNPTHRYGASKARFFAQFGFGPDNWEMLAAALREHARKSHAVLRRAVEYD